ncbi:hypothetical protein HPB49_019477 [Dermacentor silvarum]|uniref:Uncharacterized protein n=1 Tax=Dermacentor silvarum TaxID=543639 RepID=A0ACB8E1Z2_DERSI|nr:hypothetical protein HPB49_019477 [Dermacentor silvarum]
MLANNRDAALHDKVEALEVRLEELAMKIHQLHCHQLYVGGTISCVDDKVQSPMDTSLVTAKRESSQVSAEPTDAQLKVSTTDASSTCADRQDWPEMPNALQPPEMCTLVSAMGDAEHGDKTPPTQRTEFEHNQRSRPATGEESAERRSSLPRFSAKTVGEPKAPPNGEQPPSGTQLSTGSKPRSPAQHGRKYRKQQPRGPRLTTSQQNIKGGSTWIRPDPEVERELILVGDGNVGRIADAVRKVANSTKAVGFLYSKKADTEKAMRYVTSYEKEGRPVQRQYIVHDPDVTRALSVTWALRMARLAVCSIPEVTTRGGEVRAAIITANAQLKRWCRKNKHRFINLTKGWSPEKLDSDGLQYSPEGIRFAMEKMSPIIQGFLGDRHKKRQMGSSQTPANPARPQTWCPQQQQHHGRVGAAHTDRDSREQMPAQPPQRLFQASIVFILSHTGERHRLSLGVRS